MAKWIDYNEYERQALIANAVAEKHEEAIIIGIFQEDAEAAYMHDQYPVLARVGELPDTFCRCQSGRPKLSA